MGTDANGQAVSAQVSATPQIVTLRQACSDAIPREPALSPEAQARWERREEEQRREQQRKLRQQAIESREELIRCVGARYSACTLDSFVLSSPKQEAVVTALRGYVEAFPDHFPRGEGIVLFGPPGTGKDHLAMATCIAIYDRWPRWGVRNNVEFESGLNLYREIRDGMKDDQTEWETIKRLVHASVLVLSDPLPPRGPLTDWQAGILLEVIDARYRAMRPTIVTLNIANGAEGDERMGPQTLDRLKDGALSFYCDWPSHRKAQT